MRLRRAKLQTPNAERQTSIGFPIQIGTKRSPGRVAPVQRNPYAIPQCVRSVEDFSISTIT
jgi:hypothetical protein